MKRDILTIFNPANATSISEEDLATIGELTPDEVRQLAEAYPNKANQTSYLVLRDKSKPEKGQLFPASSWNNLNELYRIGQTNYVVAGFKATFQRPTGAVKTAPIQDLSKEEALGELHTAGQQQASEGEFEDLGKEAAEHGKEASGKTAPVKTAAPKTAKEAPKKAAAKKGASKKA